MKKYKICYDGWFSLKESTGMDLVFFKCTITARNKEGYTFPINIPYQMVEELIDVCSPEGFSIAAKVQKKIKGWGPQQSLYCKELEEYGFDLELIVKGIIEEKIDLEKEEQRLKSLQAAQTSGEIDLAETDNLFAEIKEEFTSYYAICSAMEKAITNEMTEMFPVLLESSSEVIRELQEIMFNHIPAFAESLNGLVLKAKKEGG